MRYKLSLIQGGLVEVTVCMSFNPKNKAALDRFESRLAKLYKEPVNGKHEDVTATILESDSGDEELCSVNDIHNNYFTLINFNWYLI